MIDIFVSHGLSPIEWASLLGSRVKASAPRRARSRTDKLVDADCGRLCSGHAGRVAGSCVKPSRPGVADFSVAPSPRTARPFSLAATAPISRPISSGSKDVSFAMASIADSVRGIGASLLVVQPTRFLLLPVPNGVFKDAARLRSILLSSTRPVSRHATRNYINLRRANRSGSRCVQRPALFKLPDSTPVVSAM